MSKRERKGRTGSSETTQSHALAITSATQRVEKHITERQIERVFEVNIGEVAPTIRVLSRLRVRNLPVDQSAEDPPGSVEEGTFRR